jgi:hypothetical protein
LNGGTISKNPLFVYEMDEKRKLVIIDDVFHGAQEK